MRRSKEKGNKNKQKCSRKNWHHKELAIINLPDLDAISRCATKGRRKLILEARRYVSPPLLLQRRTYKCNLCTSEKERRDGCSCNRRGGVGGCCCWLVPTERGYQTTSPAYEKAEGEKGGSK